MSQSSKREKESNASRKPRFADNNEPKGSPNAAYKYSQKILWLRSINMVRRVKKESTPCSG